MNCTADGIPKPGIIWFYNDAILNIKPRVTIIQQGFNRIRDDVMHPNGTSVISILNISNANQRDDSGQYTCQAENRGGLSSLNPPNNLIINVGMFIYIRYYHIASIFYCGKCCQFCEGILFVHTLTCRL